MSRNLLLLAGAAGAALAFASSAAAQTAPAQSAAAVAPEVVVTARRLDAARASVEPALGATTYSLPKAFIDNLPAGANTQLNQVVLQTPGATQDSYGQLHIRGEHGNIQYRLNNVILPEGLQVFGQTLSPRLAGNIQLITGALPAQYGLRTAGIVNITTRSGLQNGGEISLYGGSQGRIQPSVEYGGTSGATSGFASASYTGTDVGIESPDGRAVPLHDHSDQAQGFLYLDRIVGDDSRVSLIAGTSQQSFQIPNVAGQTPDLGYSVGGRASFRSEDLDSRQREGTSYGILSYLRTTDRLTVQASLFTRYSELTYHPDVVGELLFNGIAQAARKTDLSFGVQLETVYKATDAHTLRAGLIVSTDRTTSRTQSQVFRVDAAGAQIGPGPITIAEASRAQAWTYSAYLQDEWALWPTLTLNYGLRFDQLAAYRRENQVSPRASLVWRPTATLTAHLGYARYFSPPPFELVASPTVALFAGTSAAPPGLGDDLPRSERDDYFDVGLEQRLGALTLGVDAYDKQARNLVDEGQFGAPIILTPFNYRRGYARGVELSANYAKGPLTAYGNFAISRAKARDIISSQFNFDPDELAYIRDHAIFLDHDQTYTASAGVTYRLGRTHVSGDLIYGSGLRRAGDVPNGGKLPAYVQVNLGLSHELDVAGGLTLRADIVNLFDHAYRLRDGTGVGVGAPQWGPRRGVFVGLAKRF